MDLASLIRNYVDQLKKSKAEFDVANTPDKKQKHFNEYLGAIEGLHKISKGAQTTDAVTAKIKEILSSAIVNAGKMKEQLQNKTDGNKNSKRELARIPYLEESFCNIW